MEGAEPLGQRYRGLVGDDGEVGVEEPRCLLDDRLHDARMGVSGIHDADPAREVDEDVAVDVGDRRVLRALGEDRQVDEQGTRDDAFLAFRDRPGARPGYLGADLDRARGSHRFQRIRALRQ